MHARLTTLLFVPLVVAALAFGAVPARGAEFGLAAPPRVEFHKPLDITYPEATGRTNIVFDPLVRRGVFVPVLEPDTQAGGHSDLSIDMDFNTVPVGDNPFSDDMVGDLRDLDVTLPAGFNGIAPNYAACSPENLTSFNGRRGRCEFGSQVGVIAGELGDNDTVVIPVYNVRPGKDQPAQLTFELTGVTVIVELGVRSESDSRIVARTRGIRKTKFRAFRLTLWGDPADARHDGLRWTRDDEPPVNSDFDGTGDGGSGVPTPSGLPSKPFLTAPPRCDAPLQTDIRMTSWDEPDRWLDYQAVTAQRTGCDRVPFAPTVTVTPNGAQAGQPVGMAIDVDLPQTNETDLVATANLRDATVTLPPGVAISPGAAAGLGACTDEQLGAGSQAPETCPDASKVGSTRIDSPLLDEPLTGSVYLGQQLSQDPTSGDMYRLFVTAYARGVRVKLKGNVVADPTTGQLTTTFKDNLEIAFSRLRLDLKGGPRALLTNPMACGTSQVRFDATSYAGQASSSQSDYVVDGDCPTGAFAPSFTGGTLDPFAARISPFVTSIGRPDGQADLASVKLDLPPGLLGALESVPVCPEDRATAGSCAVDSRIGSTQVSTGTGSAPFPLAGNVFLAGPYKGAPFSLSIAVPAKAGPLDLGMVVVRAPLVVDAARAQVSAPVDPLPQIVGGVPLHYRSIDVNLDRPGFMFNATNCEAAEVVATLTSTSGVVSRQATRYQPQNCDQLKLSPGLRLTYGGNRSTLRRGQNPPLTADLTQTFNQANLKQVAVTLPRISSLAPENAETLCSVDQFAARSCPDGSIVGRASAKTAALPEPLTGPVYLVQGQRTTASGRVVRTLPKLYLKLEGSGVPLDLVADTSVDRQQRLVTTFANVPDAPIGAFRLEIFGGKRGILTSVQNPCQPVRRGFAEFNGQNGARVNRALQLRAPGCAPIVTASARKAKRLVRVGLANIAPGKITVTGKGLRRGTRTLVKGDRASLAARFTKATTRRVRVGRTVRVSVRVRFDPKADGQKTRTVTRRVTIRG